jgi:BirA family biotin operon repressor/biotin-[acetyl-CoA-carboxylase] ligase
MQTPQQNTERIDAALLDRLLTRDDFLTVEHLSDPATGPPERVRIELNRLHAVGCVFQWHPQRGVRLEASGIGAWADYLHWRFGVRRPIDVYGDISSTQDATRRRIESLGAAADGALVIADYQSAGRGRLGRRWVAPAGSAVLFSRACVTDDASQAPSTDALMMATAVAVAEAVESAAGSPGLLVDIRWPNDILVHGRKLAGILVERFTPADVPALGAAIIGVGINASLGRDQIPNQPANLRDTMTSLAMIGRPVDRLTVLARVIESLDQALADPDAPSLIERWRQRNTLMGDRITLQCDDREIVGDVVDLDPHDGLIVRTDTGSLVHLPGATTTILRP